MRVIEDLGSPGITVGVNGAGEVVVQFTHDDAPVATSRMSPSVWSA